MNTREIPISSPLGRIPAEDPRDRGFLLRPQISDEESAEAVNRGYRFWWQDGWWGDQWYTPRCVAYAWIHLLEDGPITHEPRKPSREAVVGMQGQALLDPANLYAEAQLRDEWEGTDYDGTSVRAGAKVLRDLGLIGAYRWAFDLETTINAILMESPVIVGTSWMTEMFDPDPETGLISIGGDFAGGHAYVLNGVNVNKEVFRIKNSWGRGWGSKGTALISFEDFDTLLQDWGEVCIPSEITLAA